MADGCGTYLMHNKPHELF